MNNIKVITAPDYTKINPDSYSIFLAGTIDSGDSVDWQSQIIKNLTDKDCLKSIAVDKCDIYIFNPRRDKWPEADQYNEIKRQIEWELQRLEESDFIIMNILPNSKSPISLLEFGLYARSGKLVMFCTEDFYRYDNVIVTAERYKVLVIKTNNIDDITENIKYILNKSYQNENQGFRKI